MKKGTKTSSFGTTSRISHDSSQYYNSKLYSGFPGDNTSPPVPDNSFPPEYINSMQLGNSESMKDIPDNSVHLMVTSPPYNVTKEYDEDLSFEQYLLLLRNVFSETYRVLVYGGRACINIANLGRKPYIPLSDYLSQMMIDIGFLMRGEIIWYKGAGAGVSMAWGSWQSASNPVLRDTHEYILVFSKGSSSLIYVKHLFGKYYRERPVYGMDKICVEFQPRISEESWSSSTLPNRVALPVNSTILIQG